MEIRFSYDHKFDNLINKIKSKYGENILRFSGIHPEQLDIADFTRDFLFGDPTVSVADRSVDSNANVDDRSVVAFDHELAKSENKLNALNMIWTYIIKVMSERGEPRSALKIANEAIESIVNCSLYMNDSHFVHKTYSYYEHTPITTRINGVVRQMTLKQLFDSYSNYAINTDDCEQIFLTDINIPVNLDLAQSQMNKNSRKTVRFKNSKFSSSHHPREIHTIEVWDNNCFVDVTRVLRHKRHNRMVEISLESGHFVLVTEDHPIILEDGTEIEAGMLKIGMSLARAERYKDWKCRYMVTNDLAYTLGFVAGDGNVPRHRFYDAANTLSNTDLAIRYDEIRNQFYAYQKDIENSKIYGCIKNLGITNKVTVHKNGKVLSFCSLQLSHCCAKVFGLNEGNSSFSKYIPRNIMEWNRDAQISYLAGVIDAEGTMMVNGKTCSIRMTSLSMINQIHELCEHLGIHSRLGVAEEGLYRVYLRVVPELRQTSVRCLPFDNLEVAAAYDASSELPKVKKLRFIDNGRPDQSGRDHYEWVYDITTSSGTFSSCGFKAHNCYSFDLTPLIFEGMPFVNKIHIGPPQHFSSMINLVIQSTAFISNQIAGAASYPNLFVYLDYFARKDFGEKYWDSPFRDQVEQGFQNLVYSLNYPFRGNQCVDENTEVLTPEGFKRYDEIFEGDSIYTWNKGSLNIQKVKAVNVYDHDGDMHSYKGRDYHQFVSPDHRILRKIHNGNTYELVKSKDAISLKSPIEFPVAMLNDDRPDYALTDEMIELAVFILTDGSIDKQNGKSTRIKWFKSPKRWGNERFVELMDHFGISYSLRSKDGWKEKDQDLYPDSYSVNCYTIPAESSGIILGLLENDSKESLPSWHTKLSRRQAQLFIETWASLDGNIDEKAYDRMNLQCDNYVIADQIQHICFLSGKGSQIQSRTIGKNKNETIYVRPYTRLNKSASTKEVVRYKGKIWCPTTDDGVVVFRKEGRIFISGNSAFTTLSLYDRPFLETLFENIVYPDGSKIDLDSVDYLQKWYFRWFNDESKKQVFTFPVTTANLACEDNSIQDESFLDYISEVNLDMGLLNIYSGPPNALSNCCRLRSKIVKEHTNSLGTGSVSIGCYDDQTEVLTDKGWILFSAAASMYKNNEQFQCITRNMETNEIQYQSPVELFESDYNGEMHHYNRQGVDLLVTPNHNMLVCSRKTGKNLLIRSDELGSSYQLPRLGAICTKPDIGKIQFGETVLDSKSFFYFLGVYLGDGAIYHDSDDAKYRAYEISFQGSKSRKIETFIKAIEGIGLSPRINDVLTRGSKTVRTYSKDLWDFLVTLGKSGDKHIPVEMLNRMGKGDLEAIYSGLIDTDGCTSQSVHFYTSSEKLANDFSDIAARLGYPTTTSWRIRKPSFLEKDKRWIKSDKRQYDVTVLVNDKTFDQISLSRTNVHYTGKIYCFEVPNHTLFVRRNGKTAWCGNSHRVCTINLPRIAIESDGDMGKFMEILKTRLYLTITILHAHRRIMEDLIKLGRLPLYTYNWMHLSKQYSTVGLIGPYEACKFMGMDITSQEGSGFITRIMDFINEVSLDEEALWKDGRRFNLELIPGEQAAIKMCEADKMIYASFPNPYKLYSNQFIPLIDKSDISERIRLQGHFDSRAQGGCIMHLNIDHQLTHKEQMKNLIRASVKAGAMYYAVNYNIAICKNKHQNIGKMNTCPKCGEKIHCNKTRVVGFITEESEWHKVRRWEYLKRVFYNETDVDESPLSVENDAHKTASA